jgi:GDPmannose 4,6-dehydratase
VKSAVIVGAGGQDGSYLAELLRQRGYSVSGLTRSSGVDILKRADVFALLEDLKPDEVYYLAAFHHSAEDKELESNDTLLFERSYAVHVHGLLHFLDAIAHVSPQTKLFYAASSHVFGAPATQPQTESTPLEPAGVYGITKTMGIHCCRYFRRERGVFAAVGILYNHESPRRLPKFLSQKIARGVLAFQKDPAQRITLGDLSAAVDWGYAPDYVDSMTRILAQATADEFIVATGQPHTVEDFLRVACDYVGVNWRDCVQTRPGLLTKRPVLLVGDSTKLRRETGWAPSVTFEEMVRLLVEDARQHSGAGVPLNTSPLKTNPNRQRGPGGTLPS